MRKFELVIDDEQDEAPVFAISIVDKPAIQKNFVAFKNEQKVKFQIDEDKRIIVGPAMIPNIMIYRSDFPKGEGEAEVFFTEDTIRKAAQMFLESELNNEVTVDHESDTDKVKMVESWIIESETHDKSQIYGMSYPVGTWMVSHKVYDDELWEEVKNGELNGYSIEGIFDFMQVFAKIEMSENVHMDFDALINDLKQCVKRFT